MSSRGEMGGGLGPVGGDPREADAEEECGGGFGYREDFDGCSGCDGGYRTYKLCSGTTSEYGRYVKSLGEPRDGVF